MKESVSDIFLLKVLVNEVKEADKSMEVEDDFVLLICCQSVDIHVSKCAGHSNAVFTN